jgi:hypothetical protein
MNKLHTLLETEPTPTKDQFEKSFRKVFGIPAELNEHDGGIIFTVHEEQFSIDFENNLLWYLNNNWEQVDTIEEARELWKNKKK